MGKGDWRPFVYGGLASCTAEFGTFPIDTTKTRLQIQGQVHDSKYAQLKYRGMTDALIKISKKEGVGALYAGIQPALLRQAIYGTIKFGTYYSLKSWVANDGKEDITVNVCCAVVAGVVSSAIANPTDVLKVRMQILGNQSYRGLFACFQDIYQNEGVGGLWRGVGPTAQRAAVIAAVELPVYDYCKHRLMGTLGDRISNHFISSFIASLGSAIASTPIDVIRTRLMNQVKLKVAVEPKDKLRIYAGSIDCLVKVRIYAGSVDCLVKTVKGEGFLALYKGFIPTWVRMGPWNVIFFITYEQLKKIY